jgi:hypothetical protein
MNANITIYFNHFCKSTLQGPLDDLSDMKTPKTGILLTISIVERVSQS